MNPLCDYCGRRPCECPGRLGKVERTMRGEKLAPIGGRRSGRTYPYLVTSDARVKCGCGSYNYTASVNGAPPVLPDNCWRCDAALPTDAMLAALTRETQP